MNKNSQFPSNNHNIHISFFFESILVKRGWCSKVEILTPKTTNIRLRDSLRKSAQPSVQDPRTEPTDTFVNCEIKHRRTGSRSNKLVDLALNPKLTRQGGRGK
ncbi:hypothetical protein CEXT_465781 [Caerostris extrusa]|uniref:Uncharacterized protein n=1 Tax=Caerostris extrusa TaxID=172846 RepID=A0AAV4PW97_CAEEX|nr:hypothetical protein CEXT_465781 [Caerostris extrusa]